MDAKIKQTAEKGVCCLATVSARIAKKLMTINLGYWFMHWFHSSGNLQTKCYTSGGNR